MTNEMSSFQSLLFDLLTGENSVKIVFDDKHKIEVNNFVKSIGSDVVHVAYKMKLDYGRVNNNYFVNTNQIKYIEY